MTGIAQIDHNAGQSFGAHLGQRRKLVLHRCGLRSRNHRLLWADLFRQLRNWRRLFVARLCHSLVLFGALYKVVQIDLIKLKESLTRQIGLFSHVGRQFVSNQAQHTEELAKHRRQIHARIKVIEHVQQIGCDNRGALMVFGCHQFLERGQLATKLPKRFIFRNRNRACAFALWLLCFCRCVFGLDLGDFALALYAFGFFLFFFSLRFFFFAALVFVLLAFVIVAAVVSVATCGRR